MENDKHYFQVGLFVLLTIAALAVFTVWFTGAYHARQYTPYIIRFNESVSGLDVGGVVKFRGIHVGNVEAMSIDPDDLSQIKVDVNILNSTPIKTDTIASLKLEGITGVIFIELSGSTPEAPFLVSENEEEPAEIPSVPSALATLMDMLPQILDKISHISDQADKMFSNKNIKALSGTISNMQEATKNANELTQDLKENPSQLIWGGKKKKKEEPK